MGNEARIVLRDQRAPPGHVHRVEYRGRWVTHALAHYWHNPPRKADSPRHDDATDTYTWTKIPPEMYGDPAITLVWDAGGQITLDELVEWWVAGSPHPGGPRGPGVFTCHTTNGEPECPAPDPEKGFCKLFPECVGFRTGRDYCYYHSSEAGRKARSRAGKVRARKPENALKLTVKKVKACSTCRGYARGYESLWLEMEKVTRTFHDSVVWTDYLRPKPFEWLPCCSCESPTVVTYGKGEVSGCALSIELWQEKDRPRTDKAWKQPFREVRPDDRQDQDAPQDPSHEDPNDYEDWNAYQGDAAWQIPWEGYEQWAKERAHSSDYEQSRRFYRHLADLARNPARRPTRADLDDETCPKIKPYRYDPEKWPEQHERIKAEIAGWRRAYREDDL